MLTTYSNIFLVNGNFDVKHTYWGFGMIVSKEGQLMGLIDFGITKSTNSELIRSDLCYELFSNYTIFSEIKKKNSRKKNTALALSAFPPSTLK